MIHGDHHNYLAAQHLVRYEALFKLLSQIQTLEDIAAISARVATQWKYFANVNRWRLIVDKDQGYLLIEGERGKAEVSTLEDLSPWDLHHYEMQRPFLIRLDKQQQNPELPSIFQKPELVDIQILPFLRGRQRIGILNVASRHDPFSDLDNKFNLIFGNYLVNRISDMVFRQQATKALVDKATKDSLTSLLNRGVIIEQLKLKIEQAKREGKPLSILLADIDHFKTINDEHGHLAGDEVLRRISKRFRQQVRNDDCLGRYGGEEFLFVLYPCTLNEAQSIAERLRQTIGNHPITFSDRLTQEINVTVSLGIYTTLWHDDISLESIIKKADRALYRSKTEGRNRATTEYDQPGS